MYIKLQIHETMPSLCFSCAAQSPRTHGSHPGCQPLPEQCFRSAVLQLPTALSCNGSMSILKLSPSSRKMPSSPGGWDPQLPCSSLSCCGAGLLAPTPEAGMDPQDALMVPSVLGHAEQICSLGDFQITVGRDVKLWQITQETITTL